MRKSWPVLESLESVVDSTQHVRVLGSERGVGSHLWMGLVGSRTSLSASKFGFCQTWSDIEQTRGQKHLRPNYYSINPPILQSSTALGNFISSKVWLSKKVPCSCWFWLYLYDWVEINGFLYGQKLVCLLRAYLANSLVSMLVIIVYCFILIPIHARRMRWELLFSILFENLNQWCI